MAAISATTSHAGALSQPRRTSCDECGSPIPKAADGIGADGPVEGCEQDPYHRAIRTLEHPLCPTKSAEEVPKRIGSPDEKPSGQEDGQEGQNTANPCVRRPMITVPK